jgi:hypothetical protein
MEIGSEVAISYTISKDVAQEIREDRAPLSVVKRFGPTDRRGFRPRRVVG